MGDNGDEENIWLQDNAFLEEGLRLGEFLERIPKAGYHLQV